MIDRHFGGSNSPDLVEQYGQFMRQFGGENRFFGHVVGDLWHQHVILSQSNVCFVDFHCGGSDIVLMDLFRLLEGTPWGEMKRIPDELVEKAKTAYLKALAETVGWEVGSELRGQFELSYACAMIRGCFRGCSYQWIHLKRENPKTWARVRLGMELARGLLEKHLPDSTGLIELASRVKRWFDENRPATDTGRVPYAALR